MDYFYNSDPFFFFFNKLSQIDIAFLLLCDRQSKHFKINDLCSIDNTMILLKIEIKNVEFVKLAIMICTKKLLRD